MKLAGCEVTLCELYTRDLNGSKATIEKELPNSLLLVRVHPVRLPLLVDLNQVHAVPPSAVTAQTAKLSQMPTRAVAHIPPTSLDPSSPRAVPSDSGDQDHAKEYLCDACGSIFDYDASDFNHSTCPAREAAAPPPEDAQTVDTVADSSWRSFRTGQWVDCCDTCGKWCEARIQLATGGRLLITYDGWRTIWDEWLPKQSQRVAPFGIFTSAISGLEQKGDGPPPGADLGGGRRMVKRPH